MWAQGFSLSVWVASWSSAALWSAAVTPGHQGAAFARVCSVRSEPGLSAWHQHGRIQQGVSLFLRARDKKDASISSRAARSERTRASGPFWTGRAAQREHGVQKHSCAQSSHVCLQWFLNLSVPLHQSLPVFLHHHRRRRHFVCTHWTQSYLEARREAVEEEVLTCFTAVKAAIPHSRNTLLEVKVLQSWLKYCTKIQIRGTCTFLQCHFYILLHYIYLTALVTNYFTTTYFYF